MKVLRILVLLLAMTMMSGCVLTKTVSVPMRIGGAIISIIPVMGNHVNNAIDKAANTVDKVPI